MHGHRPVGAALLDPEVPMRLRWIVATCAVIVAVAGGASAGAEPAGAYDALFQSPSGNIRCAYTAQVGVGCYTRNNGRYGFLESFGESYTGRASRGLPGGPVLGYGRSWRRSTFRCHSSTSGMDCWSTYTGNGFFINRSTAYAY
jgi:hypothetical protein